jgi:hypothetical protein
MKSLKHIGRMKDTNSRVLVVFRTLPGESDHALVLPVAALTSDLHDDIMKLVETPQAQDSFEFGEIMFIRTFSNGERMLQACQKDNLLRKVATTDVIMTPNTRDQVVLSDLNVYIAEQKNCAIDDLYTFVSGAKKKTDATVEEVVQIKDLGRDVGEPNIPQAQPAQPSALQQPLTDAELAKQFRSQADSMYKEAARLRREADGLDPPIVKPAKVSKSKSKSSMEAHA